MKDYIKRFIGSGLQGLIRSSSQLKLAAAMSAGLLLAGAANAAPPANDAFATAATISGTTGTTNGDNTLATLEGPCETNMVFCADQASLVNVSNSLWYVWTAPASGTVQFDTIGSGFDTVLSVWSTTNGLCDVNLTNIISDDDSGANVFNDVQSTSAASFRVVAGNVYYISVDGNAGSSGSVVLNWNMTSISTIAAGAFKFATSQTTTLGAGYVVSDTDSGGTRSGTVNGSDAGARVTVTRVGGSSGRVMVDYSVTALTYTNYFTTNTYGIQISYLYVDTGGVGYVTNYTTSTIYSSNSYGSYANGYVFNAVQTAITNTVVLITNTLGFSSISTNGPGVDHGADQRAAAQSHRRQLVFFRGRRYWPDREL